MIAVAVVAVFMGGGILAEKWVRIASAARSYDEALRLDEEGRITLAGVIASSRRLMDSRLVVCLTDNGRIIVIAAHVERANRLIDKVRNAPVELHERREIDIAEAELSLEDCRAMLEGKSEYDRAIADYTKAIQLDSKNARMYLLRAVSWRHKGEYDKEIADYTEAIRIDPKYANAYYERGISWQAKGEYRKAITDFDEAGRLDPKYATPN